MMKYAALLCIIFFVGIIVFLFSYGQRNTATFKEDAIIVLGAAVRGEMPSDPLVRRLDKAVEYHKNNPTAVIVVSGGQGFQESITEAEAMKRYLTGKGVPEEKIIKEDTSTSTEENFKNSKTALDERFSGEYSCVYITNNFHTYRAGVYAKKAGLSCTRYSAGILWYTYHINYLREFFAVIKLWVIG